MAKHELNPALPVTGIRAASSKRFEFFPSL